MTHIPTIFVAGHRGMVGSAIVRRLEAAGGCDIVVAGRETLDLLDQAAVRSFFGERKIDQVYLAAAKVGGINANNQYPADFIYENLAIQTNVIEAAFRVGVPRLLLLGSSCIYPKFAPQPMREDALLTGILEPTNAPYAIAKIAGIAMCESYVRQYGADRCDYRAIMPTNLYGPGDNYHAMNSHVIPALIRRFHEAKLQGSAKVTIWGSGTPLREFLHVDDMAEASLFLMNLPREHFVDGQGGRPSHVNAGSGAELSILELAHTVAAAVGFEGVIDTDPAMPDGTPRKLLDCGLINALGWRARIGIADGLASTYQQFLDQPVTREA